MILNAAWQLRPCRPLLPAATSSAVWPSGSLARQLGEAARARAERPLHGDRSLSRRICNSAPMRVHIGSDHAGFELKNYLIEALTEDGHEVVDHGPDIYDAEDDYPVFCIPAAEAAVADSAPCAS